MDVNEMVNALNSIFGLADSIDGTPAAAKRLTGGEQTTREVLQLDLTRFLLYVCSADGITDTDATIINLIRNDYSCSASDYSQLARTLEAPDTEKTISLMSFCLADIMLNNQNGTRSTQASDACIATFDNFGKIAVALHNNNRLASLRKETIITGMQLYAKNAIFN